jgi:hypothetical protein
MTKRIAVAVVVSVLLSGCGFPASGQVRSPSPSPGATSSSARPPGHNVSIRLKSTVPTTLSLTDGVRLDVQEYTRVLNTWRADWIDPQYIEAAVLVGHGHGQVTCQLIIDDHELAPVVASGDDPVAVCTGSSQLLPAGYQPSQTAPHKVRFTASTTGRSTVLWVTPNGAGKKAQVTGPVSISDRFATGDVHMIVINLAGTSGCGLTIDGVGQPGSTATKPGAIAVCHDFA